MITSSLIKKTPDFIEKEKIQLIIKSKYSMSPYYTRVFFKLCFYALIIQTLIPLLFFNDQSEMLKYFGFLAFFLVQSIFLHLFNYHIQL